MTDSDNYDDPTGSPPRKKKCDAKQLVYEKKFVKQWESLPKFKGWLTPSTKGQNYFHCKACGRDYKGGKSEAEKHSTYEKHRKNISTVRTQLSIKNFNYSSFDEKVINATIFTAVAAVEHNISFNAISHVPKLLPKQCPDSAIAKKITLGRTKCAAIIKNIIGKVSSDDLCEFLRHNSFSLLVDEATDNTCRKHLCLVVRTVDDKFVTTDNFFDLIKLSDATAEVLFDKIIHSFKDHNLELEKNMIGFASDGANVMMGNNNSVMSRFRILIPDLFIFKCICHSFHLCASAACEKLPMYIEVLVRDIYNYLNTSPKRTEAFIEFQKFLELKPLKMLHPAQTRWLSLSAVVSRIIEHYNALKLFFSRPSIFRKS